MDPTPRTWKEAAILYFAMYLAHNDCKSWVCLELIDKEAYKRSASKRLCYLEESNCKY